MKSNRTMKHFRPILTAACLILLGLPAVAAAQTGPTKVAAFNPSAEAKRTLQGKARARIEKIRDVKFRADMRNAYDALKAIADNTSKSRQTTLIATFHRAMLKLKADAADPTSGGISQNDCDHRLDVCKEIGSPPELCQLNDEMCIIMVIWTSWLPPDIP